MPALAQSIGLVSHGNTLRLVEVSASGMTEFDRFSFDRADEDILLTHTIFDLQMSPVNGEVYVSSFNPCNWATIGCWGNARIDRFQITSSGLNHIGPAFKFNPDTAAAAGAPSCASTDSGYSGQFGTCAPSDFTFSPDGARVYVDEDDLDYVEIFEVLANGNLTFIRTATEARTGPHGFEISNDGQYLYHSERVFQIDGDLLTQVNDGARGPQQLLLDNGLMAAIASGTLRIYDLTDPAAPNQLGQATFSENILDFATLDGTRFVVSGRSIVAVADWDGSDFTVVSELLIADGVLPNDDTARLSARGIDLFTQGGELYAVAAMFTSGADEEYDLNPAFIRGYKVASDGTVTEMWSESVMGQARNVMLAGGSKRISGQPVGSIQFAAQHSAAPLPVPVDNLWAALAVLILALTIWHHNRYRKSTSFRT